MCIVICDNTPEVICKLIEEEEECLVGKKWLRFDLLIIIGLVLWCFYATFNNISVISWWSVLLVEETRVPGENHRPPVSQ